MSSPARCASATNAGSRRAAYLHDDAAHLAAAPRSSAAIIPSMPAANRNRDRISWAALGPSPLPGVTPLRRGSMQTVRELIDRQALERGDAPFLLSPETAEVMTFGTLRDRARDAASGSERNAPD